MCGGGFNGGGGKRDGEKTDRNPAWGEKLLVPRESPRRILPGELARAGEPGQGSTRADEDTTDSLA